ncbi:hypothetical protein ACFX2C_003726 [Malus domestica]
MDWLGEVGRSNENRTDWAEGAAIATLRRRGGGKREEKLDVEEARARGIWVGWFCFDFRCWVSWDLEK